MNRNSAIIKIAEEINSIQLSHPIRVGIDGVDASGKTTLSNELGDQLKSLGRDVIRISINRFHNPREIRYQKGRTSPQGYYEDSFNYDAIISNVLQPLGPDGDLKYKPEHFDFISNSVIDCSFHHASTDSILLFEGVFLHNPIVARYWDISIFVHANFETTIKRAKKRDLYLFETPEQIQEIYSNRYIPGQKIYLETEAPEKKANVFFDNNDIENPELIIQ